MTRNLTCCCCGESAGKWAQWFNRDTGYGVCAKCVEWVRSRGESESEIRSNYGIEGVNYAPRMQSNPQSHEEMESEYLEFTGRKVQSRNLGQDPQISTDRQA